MQTETATVRFSTRSYLLQQGPHLRLRVLLLAAVLPAQSSPKHLHSVACELGAITWCG